MNLIGHNYIAKEVLSRYNPQIAAGTHIPDLVPFLSKSVFTFDEIHENPEAVYRYAVRNNSEYIDLALGMMTHSVKYGADKYNQEIDTWLIGKDTSLLDEIAQRIVRSSEVFLETAKVSRMHNYLWFGLDFYLINKFPDFTRQVQKAYKQVDLESISKVLSDVYNKDMIKTRENLEDYIGIINKYDITVPKEFISFFKEFSSQLPEKDNVDVEEVASCANFIYSKFEKLWPLILNKIIIDIKGRMEEFLT